MQPEAAAAETAAAAASTAVSQFSFTSSCFGPKSAKTETVVNPAHYHKNSALFVSVQLRCFHSKNVSAYLVTHTTSGKMLFF